jgi:hypothetical protein
MDPQYGDQPAPGGNPYDFIMSPTKPPKKGVFGGSGGGHSEFFFKLALIGGGAIVLMAAIAIGVNLFFGGKTNVEDLVQITEMQQEIIRIAALNDQATDQTVLNAAVSTKLSVTTQQQSLLAYLKKHKRIVKSKELSLKQDTTTDKQLREAVASSTFDIVFTQDMRNQLTTYASALKTSYKNSTSTSGKQLLSAEYNQVQLLLAQWPAGTAPAGQ